MNEENSITPTSFTRDELLVFNAISILYESVDVVEDIPAMLAAFERDERARDSMMEVLVRSADEGFQRVFTRPGDTH